MNKTSVIISFILSLLMLCSCAKKLIPTEVSPQEQDGYRGKLRVAGNKIIDSNGRPVVLEGLNTCYASYMQENGHWNESYFAGMKEWGAQIVRLEVEPGAYRRIGKDATLALIEQGVGWAKNQGMYTIIEWHSIGNPVSLIFQPPWEDSLGTTPEEMKEFWGAVARHFRDEPAAAFYEIFNEPASMFWLGGTLTWEQWKNLADEVIDIIYTENPHAIPVVGGLDWSFDLSMAASSPLRNTGIAFAAHPYAGHAQEPWEANWETKFGYLAAYHPVILTEFGYDPDDTMYPDVYRATDDYGHRIIAYARQKGMSWTAYIFANYSGWSMPLFTDWTNYTPTQSGALFKSKLQEH